MPSRHAALKRIYFGDGVANAEALGGEADNKNSEYRLDDIGEKCLSCRVLIDAPGNEMSAADAEKCRFAEGCR